MPVAIIFAMSRRQSVILSFASLTARASASISCRQALELLGAHDQRREVETEGELDLPSPALSRVALAIRAVAPNDQPCVHQRRKLPPQGRCRHAVRP